MHEHDVEIASVATRVIRTGGDPERPAFLFLHGFSDSADGWRRLQRRLSEAGHVTMAVDQPGHGRAAALDFSRPVIPQFIDFAAAAARATHDGAPVIVVGNSLGGAHALLLAQHHPELVHGVVAISPASFDHPRWFGVLDDDNRIGSRLRRGEVLESIGRREHESPRRRRARSRIAGAGIRAVAFGAPWRAPDGFVRDLRQQFREPERREAFRELAMRFREEYVDASPIDLGSISVPVQALWGTRDRLVLVSSRRTLESELVDLDFVELPGIGHMPQLESPGRTTKHILRFAQRFSPVGGAR